MLIAMAMCHFCQFLCCWRIGELDGNRTHDHQSHNLALCQLSYKLHIKKLPPEPKSGVFLNSFFKWSLVESNHVLRIFIPAHTPSLPKLLTDIVTAEFVLPLF